MERKKQSMRMRWIGCSLLLLISAGVIQGDQEDQGYRDECQTDFFWLLNDDSWKVMEIEKELLGVEDPDNTKIGQVTVTELLRFRDTSCQLEGLTENHFYEPGPIYCTQEKENVDFRKDEAFPLVSGRFLVKVYNKGLQRYCEHYRIERRKACAKEMHRFLQVALDEIKQDQGNEIEILEGFYSRWKEDGKMDFTEHINFWYVRKDYFSSCVTLIRTLKKNIPHHATLGFRDYDELIGKWSRLSDACKKYGKKRCSKWAVRQLKDWKEQCQIIKESSPDL